MRTPPLTRRVGIGFALALASSPLFAEGARIVEAPGLPPFIDLQEAVDAATDGDTILVAGGVYDGFTIEDKGLSVVGVPGHGVRIEGPVQILDLGVDRNVVLSGLEMVGLTHPGISGPGLVVEDSLGHVRVESCTIRGGRGFYLHFLGPFGDGGHAVTVHASARVAFSHCSITGGTGAGSDICEFQCKGGDGGFGVQLDSSMVALFECSIRGGDAGDADFGGAGGHGVSLVDSWVFAAGTSFSGGNGGEGDCFFSQPGAPGAGGAGLDVGGGSWAGLLDDTYAGGFGAGGWDCEVAPDGPGVGGPGTAMQYPGATRSLETEDLELDHSTLTIAVRGQPGDQVWLRAGTEPGFHFLPSLPGVQLVRSWHVTSEPQVIPSSGQFLMSYPLPDLTARPA